jgi:hypothetical protein
MCKAARHGYVDSISRRGLCLYSGVCWGVPALTAALLRDSMGGAGQQCWISDEWQWAR